MPHVAPSMPPALQAATFVQGASGVSDVERFCSLAEQRPGAELARPRHLHDASAAEHAAVIRENQAAYFGMVLPQPAIDVYDQVRVVLRAALLTGAAGVQRAPRAGRAHG